MQFPNSPHAEGWQPQMRNADAISPSRQRRQQHALALIVAAGTLGAAAVMALIDDPRPLDVQLSTALSRAGHTLNDWQQQLSRGLQVSLLAVADGQDAPPPAQVTATRVPAAASAPAVAPTDQ